LEQGVEVIRISWEDRLGKKQRVKRWHSRALEEEKSGKGRKGIELEEGR
jgi:hypothetical protein